MTGCCDDFDTYKLEYQLIRVFSLLMTFSQMRLPWGGVEMFGIVSMRSGVHHASK